MSRAPAGRSAAKASTRGAAPASARAPDRRDSTPGSRAGRGGARDLVAVSPVPARSASAARAAASRSTVRATGHEGLRQMMSGNAARRLGIELVSAGPRRVVARLAIRPEHLNRGERVNGGVLMAFADLLGAAGTVLNLPPGHRTTTLESKTNFFAAGQGPALTATSKPLHIGRSTSVWQTRIENDDGRLVAIVTQTQIILPPATGAS